MWFFLTFVLLTFPEGIYWRFCNGHKALHCDKWWYIGAFFACQVIFGIFFRGAGMAGGFSEKGVGPGKEGGYPCCVRFAITPQV